MGAHVYAEDESLPGVWNPTKQVHESEPKLNGFEAGSPRVMDYAGPLRAGSPRGFQPNPNSKSKLGELVNGLQSQSRFTVLEDSPRAAPRTVKSAKAAEKFFPTISEAEKALQQEQMISQFVPCWGEACKLLNEINSISRFT